MKRKTLSLAHARGFHVDDLEVIVLELASDEAPSGLTRAEREVARLAASGLHNHEIARARGTSVRTVANQLGAVYRKLGLASRFELAAWWTRTRAEPRAG